VTNLPSISKGLKACGKIIKRVNIRKVSIRVEEINFTLSSFITAST